MRDSHTFRKSTPRCAWLLLLAGLLLLPGSPLVLQGRAEPREASDPSAVEEKVAELENASRRAGLTAEETAAVAELARRVRADNRELFKLHAGGKLSEVQKRGVDKLVGVYGHPLEKELAGVREVAARAKLTAAETAAAERVALQEGFDEDAIVCRYETGKMCKVEKSAFEKIIAIEGHPRAEEIDRLTEVSRQAGLSDEQIQALRGLAARADWDLEKIAELKRTGQLSEAEASALAKLEPVIARLKSGADAHDSEKARGFRKLAKMAGLTDAEALALMEAARQAGDDERGLLEAKRSGTLSAPAAAGLKKLEAMLGKIEDFVDSPYKQEIGKLLETASQAGLTPEETGALVKLAVRVEFNLNAVRELRASGKLTETEIYALDKLLVALGR